MTSKTLDLKTPPGHQVLAAARKKICALADEPSQISFLNGLTFNLVKQS